MCTGETLEISPEMSIQQQEMSIQNGDSGILTNGGHTTSDHPNETSTAMILPPHHHHHHNQNYEEEDDEDVLNHEHDDDDEDVYLHIMQTKNE